MARERRPDRSYNCHIARLLVHENFESDRFSLELARRRLRPARGIRHFDRAGCGTAGFSRLAYGGTEDLMRGRMSWRDQHTAFPFPLGRACEKNSF